MQKELWPRAGRQKQKPLLSDVHPTMKRSVALFRPGLQSLAAKDRLCRIECCARFKRLGPVAWAKWTGYMLYKRTKPKAAVLYGSHSKLRHFIAWRDLVDQVCQLGFISVVMCMS